VAACICSNFLSELLEGMESPGMLVAKQLLGLLRGETSDHLNRVVRKALYVKRWICTLTERRPQVVERAVRATGRAAARTEDVWEGALPVLAELPI
jgi:acyl carrier protein phosphodiesterase